MAAACSLIDEDMRDCETDTRLDYELRLVTNMTTELQTQLSLEEDAEVAAMGYDAPLWFKIKGKRKFSVAPRQ